LRKGNISQLRNPLIADLFRRIEMVEAWGRGMPLILKNAPDVVFREIGNLFIVSFNRPSFLDQKDEGEATTQETTQEKSKTPKETPEKPQRSDSRCPKETAFHQHQGTICSMRHECPQRTTPH
jgi:ATP-dependent DNA helicase RecG